MRKKHLILTLVMVLLASVMIFFCGCGNDENDLPVSAGVDDIDTALNVDEPQDGEDDTVVSDDDDDIDSNSKGDQNEHSNQNSQDKPDKSQPVDSAASIPNYPADAPWEGFDMYGLPPVLDTLSKDDGDLLVLVNKLHAVSKNYRPDDMVSIDGKYTTNQGLEMKSEAYDAYLKMRKAARKEEIYFKICSAYRTYGTQEYLYNSYLGSMGEKLRNIRSAYPGRSEHHTGYAIDITSKSMGWSLSQAFADYPEGEWINEHCSEYGFIIRYPKGKTDITGYDYEPWHLRYVGTEVAAEITEQGITLEEYLGR